MNGARLAQTDGLQVLYSAMEALNDDLCSPCSSVGIFTDSDRPDRSSNNLHIQPQ